MVAAFKVGTPWVLANCEATSHRFTKCFAFSLKHQLILIQYNHLESVIGACNLLERVKQGKPLTWGATLTLWGVGPARWAPCGRSTRTRGGASAYAETPRSDSPGCRVSVAAEKRKTQKTTCQSDAHTNTPAKPLLRDLPPSVACPYQNTLNSNHMVINHAVARDNPSPSGPIYELLVSSRPLTLPPSAWLITPATSASLIIIRQH